MLHAFQLGAYCGGVLVFLAVLDVTGRGIWGWSGCREGPVRAAGDRRRMVVRLMVVPLMSHGRPAARNEAAPPALRRPQYRGLDGKGGNHPTEPGRVSKVPGEDDGEPICDPE
ncbi:hypothetical protein [Streptomyces gelaticus]|uniref:hypothetical protein n=1 Tax=Streptomyces gelaticus TaxID=285446 RepID=UPI00167B10DE|nr:hypothetical protein [Streptomyces gelaticus]